jgi:putative tricarboxylic transport membrane protein
MAPERLPGDLKDVPTAKEQGFDFDWVVWRGYYVGAKVSDADYQYWVDALQKLAKTPEFEKEREARGLFPYTVLGADFDKVVKDDVKKFKTLAAEAGL